MQAQRIELFRHEMAHFVNVLQQHVLDQVLGAHWEEAVGKIKVAETLGALRSALEGFRLVSARQCFVGSDKLGGLISMRIKSLLNVVIAFAQMTRTAEEGGQGVWEEEGGKVDALMDAWKSTLDFLLTVMNSRIHTGSATREGADFERFMLMLDYNGWFAQAGV